MGFSALAVRGRGGVCSGYVGWCVQMAAKAGRWDGAGRSVDVCGRVAALCSERRVSVSFACIGVGGGFLPESVVGGRVVGRVSEAEERGKRQMMASERRGVAWCGVAWDVPCVAPRVRDW